MTWNQTYRMKGQKQEDNCPFQIIEIFHIYILKKNSGSKVTNDMQKAP